MKRRAITLLIVGLAWAAIGIATTARAATTLANIAVNKSTQGTEAYGYPSRYGNDESRFATSFTHGDDSLNSYWQIDLGAQYTVEQVNIHCRIPWGDPPWDGWTYNIDRLNGARLQAYDAAMTAVGDPIVLSGYANGAGWFAEDNAWNLPWKNNGGPWVGVQYFRLGDQGDLGGYTPQYLQFSEFQAMVDVETYPNFVPRVTATATDSWGMGTDAMSLVNNSGMDDQNVGIGNPAALHADVWGDGLWHSSYNPVEDPVVTFDLAKKYDLSQMVIWNEHQTAGDAGRCVKECTIEYSTNGTGWTALADANDWELGNYTLTEYDTVGGIPPWPASDTINLGPENVEGRYVRITIHSSWGDVPGGERNYVGLSEVRFYGEAIDVPQIPGDTDGDLIVDADDATVLAQHWGESVPMGDYTYGDFSGDGLVNAVDASILAANWGNHVGESAAVPEPSVLAMVGSVLALAALGARRIARPGRR